MTFTEQRERASEFPTPREEIESLRQQLASRDAEIAELREQVAELKAWNSELVKHQDALADKCDTLREQVTLLRDALKDAVAALEHRWEVIANRAAPVMESVIDAAHTKGVEALAATEQK